MNPAGIQRKRREAGVTIVEMIVTVAIVGAVMAGVLTLYTVFLRSYNSTTLSRASSSRSCLTLERMVFGVGTNAGLREAASTTFSCSQLTNGWKIAYNTNLWFQYNSSTKKITDQSDKQIGMNIISSSAINYTNSVLISVTVGESGLGRTSTNSMQTLVQFRN